MIANLQQLHTTEEVAAAKKVSCDYLRQLVKDGKATPYRLSTARNAPMRWAAEHVRQVDEAMTPAQPTEPVRRRRRSRRT